MENEITEGGDMFGGVDFNADVVFDVDAKGEVVGSKSIIKPEDTDPKDGKEEKEEKEEKENIVKEKPLEGSASSSPSEPISLFASALSESGVIIAEEDRIKETKTYEGLVDLIKDTVKQNELSDLSEDAKKVLTDIRAGVPLRVIQDHHNTQTGLDSISEDQYMDKEADDDEERDLKQQIRKKLIVQSYMINGYSEERSLKLAQRSIDIGEDAEDAKAAIKDMKDADLNRIERERSEAEARKVEAKRRLEDLKGTVMSTEEILPNIPISEKLRKQVFDTMTKPIGSGPNGPVYTIQNERNKDPLAFDLRLHYLYALGLFEETPDISVFTRTEKSKAAQKFQEAVRSREFGGGSNEPQLHGAVDEDLLDSISSMKF